jgi:hypothetical protein
MINNTLKEIFWSEGDFFDQYKKPISNIIPVGIPELFEINAGHELLKDYLLPRLKSLRKEHKEYIMANTYLKGKLLPYSEYSVDRIDRIAVCFYYVRIE